MKRITVPSFLKRDTAIAPTYQFEGQVSTMNLDRADFHSLLDRSTQVCMDKCMPVRYREACIPIQERDHVFRDGTRRPEKSRVRDLPTQSIPLTAPLSRHKCMHDDVHRATGQTVFPIPSRRASLRNRSSAMICMFKYDARFRAKAKHTLEGLDIPELGSMLGSIIS